MDNSSTAIWVNLFKPALTCCICLLGAVETPTCHYTFILEKGKWVNKQLLITSAVWSHVCGDLT